MSYTNKVPNSNVDMMMVDNIKESTDNLIDYLMDNLPDTKERAVAITNYEQAAMWAVKGVANKNK